MMNKKTLLICAAIIATGVLSFAAYSKITAPSTYDECVMQNIKPGDSDTAAKYKAVSCYNMFKKENPYEKLKQKD